MSRRKVNVYCQYCNAEFETILRWEGVPEKEYCSLECEVDDEFGDNEVFEKRPKGGRIEWH